MKLLVAIMLVTIAMCNAEPPRFGQFQRQTADSAPYAPRGWRPQGAAFSLPQRTYGAPPQTYGPPATEYNPPEEVTTTEQPQTTTETETEASTETIQAERLSDAARKSGKLENAADANPVFLVVPRKQNFVYTFQRSAPLTAAPQAVFLTSSEVRALPIKAAFSTSYYTPYASYVQIYQ